MTPELRKYPRTPHLQGSRLQPGDEDLTSTPLRHLQHRYLVVEEKVDGANAALRCSPEGELLLQSRGHYLTGGPRERHFARFKEWAHTHTAIWWDCLGSRYVLFGEWLYARHTIFYNALPHYFLEFDVLDLEAGAFLSTERRRTLLEGAPLCSVPVLEEGNSAHPERLPHLIGPSHFIRGNHLSDLHRIAKRAGADPDLALAESDPSSTMEGLYVKVEEEGEVVERYKYIRPSFLTAVLQSGSHWLDRPLLPNQLAPEVDW
ncbi:MAG: RNA ligase family protein [Verrucomicrobiota bacterium]